ncbi:hypothetical protein G9A89_006229 [Geosiphon pyriformis]|nr:hypothetical protein G9A89_006229 [Geosiphon pyriformis]
MALSLETCLSAKKNHVNTIYFCNVSYKKLKKTLFGNVVDLSAGPLSLKDIGDADVKNMANIVAKETSYAESGEDNDIDETTPRKICIQTYMLSKPLKQPLFEHISNNDNELKLPPCVVIESNQSLLFKSHVPIKWNFDLTKFFTLDIELSAVPEKMVGNKLIFLKKNFYQVDSFGRASTSSKFPRIIRSFFTSKLNLKRARELAICEKIVVNDGLKKVIIKEIPVDFSKLAIKSVFSKFGKIVSIKMQLIGVWQKALVEFESPEIANSVVKILCMDQHWALLYTLPVGITSHDLSDLLDSYGKKTCFIGHNLNFYVCDKCAVVCFADETSKLAAFGFIPVFKSVILHWTSLSLTCCAKCKQFGHISNACSVGGNVGVHGKQVAFVVRLVSFGGKTWAQVAGSILSCVVFSGSFGAGQSPGAKTFSFASVSSSGLDLYNHITFLKHFLELLANQISGILKKLSLVDSVPLVVASEVFSLVVPVSVAFGLNSDIALVGKLVSSVSPSLVVNNMINSLSSSSSKVLTTKVGGLESKMLALEILVESVLEKLDYLCSGLSLLAFFSSQ